MKALLAVLLIANVAAANITFHGNQYFASSQLSRLSRSTASLEEILRLVEDAYINDGYFQISTTPRISADTIIEISEGKLFTARDVRLTGVDTTLLDLKDLLDGNQPASSQFIHALTMSIVESYSEAGYPFCQVDVRQIDVRSDFVSIELHVITGPSTTFGVSEFRGLTTTKPERLARRIAIREGMLYSESILTKSRRALSRLEFSQVTQNPVVAHNTRSGAADVVFFMQDRRNLIIEGVFFLNPDNSLGGSGELGLQNAFGTGESTRLEFSRQNDFSRELSIEAQFPFFQGTPIDIDLSLAQLDRDSSFISSAIKVGAGYHLSDQWLLGATVQWEKITPEEGRLEPSARIWQVLLKTSYDTRDNISMTRRGFLIRTEFGSSYRKSFAGGNEPVTGYSSLFNISGSSWFPPASKLVFFNKVLVFQVRSDFSPLPSEQLIAVGGPNSVRGYRERTFLAELGMVSNTEIRYLIDEGFVAHLFCDNTYIEAQSRPKKLTGFGAGIMVSTTQGDFSLDFSLGEEKKLDKMLVHFGFMTGL